MLIDVHSHLFKYPDHFTEDFRRQSFRGRNKELDLTVRWEEYHRAATQCDNTIVFGGKAKLSGLWVPDRDVANYVQQHPDKLIGFLSIDPTQPGWQDELHEGHQDLKLKGIKLLSMYAGFKPNQPELNYVWEYATRHHLPVLLHTGTTFIDKAPLECTLPRLLDDVAIRFPNVKIVMAHLSHPYEGESVVTIRKHPNVYADCSALHYRPFQLYRSSSCSFKSTAFGRKSCSAVTTHSPLWMPVSEGMRKLNDMLAGTALPRLDMDQMEKMFYRKTLELLEIDV